MIYLNNNTELQEVWIPKNDGTGSSHKPTKDLEGVDVTISQDITVVHPSSGYYGMSAVTIDASEYGQSNYDEGFDDGYTDGYSSGTIDGEQSIIDTFTSTTITINGQYGSSANPYSSVTVNVAQTGHTDEELQEAYESGYTSGSTDGYNSGYTSGETHQKSLLGTTAFTINGSYSAENGYSAITVNVPTGQTYNIEENHPFTATSNGDYTITPTSASTTVNTEYVPNQYGSGTYILTAYTQGYPSVGLFNLIKVYRESNPSDYAILYYKNGRLGYNLSEWGGSSVNLHDNVYSFYFVGNDCAWSPLEDYTFSYDVMSAVTLEVNVETASTYQSGYTSGYTDGYASGYTSGTTDGFNSGYTSGYTSGHTDGVDEEKAKMSAVTFTANTAVTLSDGSYSAVTVNVPQTGSTAVLGVGSFSANGTYFSSTDNLDGYSAITVNVPQTGSSGVKYVEYIETDGSNIVYDTGIKITSNNVKIYLDYMRHSGSTEDYTGLVSQMYNDMLFSYLFFVPGNWNRDIIMPRFGGDNYEVPSLLDTYYETVVSNTGATINGVDYPHTFSGFQETDEHMYLNAQHHYGSFRRFAIARYYRFAVESGGTLLVDMRPALDENNVTCFYDEVSETYIYHTGTGTPTAGPVLDPSYASGYTDGYASGYTDGSASIASLIDKSITEIVIPNGVTRIGNYAFSYCTSLSSVTIPSGVTAIYGSAFKDCRSLSSVTIPPSVITIGDNTFYGDYSLQSITIPNSVTKISNNAFNACSSLSSITLSSAITAIENYLFTGCRSLSSITIPSLVGTIGTQAFRNCSALTDIYISAATAPTINNANAFQGIPSTGTVHYPQGSDYSSWQSNTYLSGWTFVADL